MIKKFGLLALKFLRSYLFVSVVVVLTLCLAIWFFGPNLKIMNVRPLASEVNRIIAIAIVLGLWALNNLRLQLKALREARQAALPQEAPSEPVVQKDPRLEELDNSFKNSLKKLVDNLPGSRAKVPYKLPWYLILGRASAGKTSLLAASNFRLPFAAQFGQQDRLNVSPTPLLDWWVGDQGLVLDIAGELTDHQDQGAFADEPVWQRLLDNLLRFRRRRPLDGAILVVDAKELVASSDEARVRQSSIFRWRVKELIAKLGNQIPIYVVVSKFDLLEGFDTVFGRLSQSEREELLGFTFPILRNAAPGQWLHEFGDEYEGFVGALQDRLFERLRDLKTETDRRAAFTFVRQLSGMQGLLHDFMREVFLEDEFSTPPLIRGLYFSSSKQEGVAVSGLESAVFHDYGLPPAVKPSAQTRKRPFFAGNILERVIFPEAGLAGDNYRLARSKRNWRLATAGLCFAAVATLSGLWFLQYSRTMDGIGDLKTAMATLDEAEARANTFDSLGLRQVEALNTWSSARNIFGSGENPFAHVTGLGLYKGHLIGPQIGETYAQKASAPFYSNLFLGAEARLTDSFEEYQRIRQIEADLPDLLSAANPGNQAEGEGEGEGEGFVPQTASLRSLLQRLRDRRMLAADFSEIGQETDETRELDRLASRISAYEEQRIGFEALAQDLRAAVRAKRAALENETLGHLAVYKIMARPGDDEDPDRALVVRAAFEELWSDAAEGQRDLQAQAMAHLSFVQETNLRAKPEVQLVMTLSDDQVAQQELIVDTLKEVPAQARVYQDIVRFAANETPTIVIQDELGPVYSQLFEGGREDIASQVPGLYSAQQFRRFFLPQNADLSGRAVRSAWVLGAPSDFTDADVEAFQEEVRRAYVREFITAWRALVGDLRLQSFDGLADAERKLQRIVGSEDPYRRLLASVERHTNMGGPTPDGGVLGEDADAAALDARGAREVTLAFASLHEMDEIREGEERSNLDVALAAVENVYQYVKSINEAADPRDKALALAKARANLSSDDPILDLRRVANSLPEPFQSHFTQIADQTWFAVMQSAEQRLNTLWQDQVFQFYTSNLQSQYPFNPNATEQANFTEFSDFLSSNGRVEQFFEEHLEPFIDPVTRNGVSIDGYKLNFSNDALQALERVRNIQQAYFRSDGSFGLTFTMTPLAMGAGASRVIIDIDGQALAYRHGPQRTVNFIWPNTLSDQQGSRLTFIPSTTGRASTTIGGEGAWSFFRLVDQAGKNDISDERITLNFEQNGQRLAMRVETADSLNPFSIDLGRELSLPFLLVGAGANSSTGSLGTTPQANE